MFWRQENERKWGKMRESRDKMREKKRVTIKN